MNRQTYNDPPLNPRCALFELSETKSIVGRTYGTGGVEAGH
jgi:hypothetical protein